MSYFLQPLHVFIAVLVEYVRKQQEMVIEYLQVENQVLREQLGGNRVLLTNDQRRLLAVKGKALGRKQLASIATIAQADTILRWHRELMDSKDDSKPTKTGRPRKSQEVVNLVLRMARENVGWGYKRIEGAVHNLGYAICSSTVANILKQHGIEPAPSRRRTISWSTFLKAHWEVFEGIDLDAIRLRLIEWLNSFFVPHSEAIPRITAEASQDVMQEPAKAIRIHIPTKVANKETQLARASPDPARFISPISISDIRRAA